MDLYTKEELETLKKFIAETGEKDNFKGTLESINNCINLLEVEDKEE